MPSPVTLSVGISHERNDWLLSPTLYRNYGGYRAVKRDHLENEIREEFIVRAPIMCESFPAGDDIRIQAIHIDRRFTTEDAPITLRLNYQK